MAVGGVRSRYVCDSVCCLMLRVAVFYVVCVNVLAFVVYGYDKCCARLSRRRVSERCLFLLALIGGAAGAWMSMCLFRHKTCHWRFVVFVPLLLLLQVFLGVWVYEWLCGV